MDVDFFISKSDPMSHTSFTPDMVYWPPEYIDIGKYTERSQIYSLSFLMLTSMLGEPPIKAINQEDLKEAITLNQIKFPDNLPKGFLAFLKRGVSIAPNNRFFSLAEFKLALNQLKRQLAEKNSEKNTGNSRRIEKL